jgi:hypothetical protein
MVKTEQKGRSAIMVRTERGRKVVASEIETGDMIADAITVKDMLGYNKHLVIDSKHPRHGWMSAYQLAFWGRVKYLPALIRSLMRTKQIGLKTTIKARLSRRYYY